MKYRIFGPFLSGQAELPKNLFPAQRNDKARRIVIAGYEEEELVSYALFSEDLHEKQSIWLDHFQTMEGFREQGKAGELLNYCAEFFRDKGASAILCRIIIDVEQAAEFHGYFTKRDYIPLTLTGRLLDYQLSDMVAPGVFQLLEKKREKLPPMVTWKEARKLEGFDDLHVIPDEEERELSRYLLLNGKPVGCALCSMPEKGTLMVSEIVLNNEAKKKGLFMPLFYSVVKAAEKDKRGDLRILLCVKDEGAYRGLSQVFNPPEQEYLVQEYMRLLVSEG